MELGDKKNIRRWLVSARWDLLVFVTPVLIAVLFSIYWSEYSDTDRTPIWAFLLLIIAFDVSHVWASAYRTYFDTHEIRRRPLLYLGILPPCFIFSLLVHYYDPIIFWTIIAYIALWHFVRQPYGFVAMYRLLRKEGNKIDQWLDQLSIYVAALGPILAWHASPERQFDWFGHNEQFILRIPEEYKLLIATIYFGFALVYLVRQIYLILFTRAFNLGKQVIIGLTWVTWALGIAISDPLISAAFINLFHGIPFLAITWLYGHNKYQKGLLGSIFKTKNLQWFFLIVFIPAFLEEGLWDSIFWGQYSSIFPSLLIPNNNEFLLSFLCALLIMPQLVHYILDAFIWKMNSTNPDLRKYLGLL